jgi:hypothetical protein
VSTVSLFAHPVFREAMADLAMLGVRVSAQREHGAKEYAVVGGRSNARWWLIPLESGSVAASGLALFQPLLTNARRMKWVAQFLSRAGLQRLWARHRVYLAGEPALGTYFRDRSAASFAYFTGTDSPHRKLAVQVMDRAGGLMGFAKVTRNSQVARLLEHESIMLRRARALDLHSAHIPKVLFHGNTAAGALLVTDTLKTARTPAATHLTPVHHAFLEELARKTSGGQPLLGRNLASHYAERLAHCASRLEPEWHDRIVKAIALLERHGDTRFPAVLAQGDFTPWNTFLVEDRLYVFDWEYAQSRQVRGTDLVHFVLNQPELRSQSAGDKLRAALAAMQDRYEGAHQFAARLTVLAYLLTQLFLQVGRLEADCVAWDGAAECAAMLDLLLLEAKP